MEIPVFTWTGCYPASRVVTPGQMSASTRADLAIDDLNGGLFGGYLGYNWQSGAWVFGAEGDFNGLWNDQTSGRRAAALTIDIGTDWLASIRARAATPSIGR